MIKGVIFDMDGVLVDSEAFINKAAVLMFREKQIVVEPEDFMPFVGAGENRYIGGVAEKYGIDIDIISAKARTYEIYREIVPGKLQPLPGALELVARCRDAGLKTAIATSADRIKMETNLSAIGLPAERFDALVNGLDVDKRKPYPDIFLHAAKLLALAPGWCLVVEDAPNGVEAARAAGSRCLAVTSTFGADKLKAADWVVDTLLHLPQEIISW